MQDMPDIAALSHQVMVEQTPEGLRIQLVDEDGRPMFQPGTSTPLPYTRKMLETVAGIIDRLPNRISISGHTDGSPFQGADGTTNWELSSARANAARQILTSAGVSGSRVYEVLRKVRIGAAAARRPQRIRQPPYLHPADEGSPAGSAG